MSVVAGFQGKECARQVLKLGLDDESFKYAAKMLKHFRTLIKKLENIDVGKMKREQKLAFWINIHNALVMHWQQSLLSPGRKSSTVPQRHVYAIEYPEPLVHFTLSLGAFSDPVEKNIFGDLRVAKQEFIRSNVHIHKEYSKVYVPKILYYFAKDMALTVPGLLEPVNACLPESQRRVIERNVKGKADKYVCWLSQSSIFGYVIHRDAVEGV
ncbi:hypothetical protein L2E82_06368 [Cichorium intybus]|uniref:Uncharacterized protein n=1 Tax=Cichorium intybus TaxID=13427 RepID=A0ACB9H9D6_CICIN|nr:hypothetical protein L2E82_06368 [Cichorium intybus]